MKTAFLWLSILGLAALSDLTLPKTHHPIAGFAVCLGGLI